MATLQTADAFTSQFPGKEGRCFFQDIDLASQLLVLGFELADTLLLDGQRLADAGLPQLLCIDLAPA